MPSSVVLAQTSTHPSPSSPPWWQALPRPQWGKFKKVDQDQSWFEVYQVLPGVMAIYEAGHWEQVISYLILGEERALLFDTGMGIGDMKRLVSKLTALEVWVLNSHTHYDHVGSNHQFRNIYGTDTEYTQKSGQGIPPARARRFVPLESLWPKRVPAGFKRRKYEIKPFAVHRVVRDGEKIDLGGRVLEILLTPGHSPDSLCLLDRENRALFTGDTFYIGSLYAHLPGSNVESYGQSAARLAEVGKDVDRLLPAHTPPFVDAVYLQRLDQAFKAISSRRASFTEGQTPGLPGRNRQYRFQGFSIVVKDPQE